MSPIVLQPAPLAYPVVFKAPTRLEAVEVKRLRPELDRLAALAGDVIIDLARTEAIDGSGVGAIVYVYKRLSERGHRVTVRNVSGQPSALLGAAGLLRTLGAVPSQGFLQKFARPLRWAAAPLPAVMVANEPANVTAAEPTQQARAARAQGAA